MKAKQKLRRMDTNNEARRLHAMVCEPRCK